MNLDEDLQRILTIGAKIYNTKSKRQGKVVDSIGGQFHMDYNGTGTEIYSIEEFSKMLVSDEIVSNSRLTMGSGSNFKVLPRIAGTTGTTVTAPKIPSASNIPIAKSTEFEVGYIKVETGRFSKEPKKGYIKVEYRKAIETVTLELTSEQLEQLKEMGIV